ncbi:MAG: hypothetical protein JSW55_12415 [Chloroflexota bacterium]|nr:MAG: hypothetical protein JSW55_12415 [Chloroflexota bacterium]
MTRVIILTQMWSSWPDFAGSTWVPMQYLLGLLKLGVDAYWIDYLDRPDPQKQVHSLEYLVKRFVGTARDFEFSERACVVFEGGRRYYGMSENTLQELAARTDLLIGISGKGIPNGSPLKQIERRAYIDVDPGFTQIWAEQLDMGLDQFNIFFTVGQTIGRPESAMPALGFEWHPILPPVFLDQWPACIDEQNERFSTVGDWWGDQRASYEGEYYGGKRDEFLRFVQLPLRANQRLEPALTIYQIDHEEIGLLHRNDWRILDPFLHAGDPHSYREFIQSSRAEFSVAKGGYVRANAGWISDRTACYLASGKPALVQSTGIEPYVPTGEGLLTFATLEEAVAGIVAINGDYLVHCQAARKLAEERFNSDVVLAYLLQRAGL